MRHAQALALKFPLSLGDRKLQGVCNAGDSVTTTPDQYCMEEVLGAQNYGCTANDVRVASVTIK